MTNLVDNLKGEKHPVASWTSGDKRISKSRQHQDMYIVSFLDGGWFSISSDYKTMVLSNPPDSK